MHYHSNHMWCQQSNWDDEFYDARHMVSIAKWYEHPPHTPYNDWVTAADWVNIVEDREIVSRVRRATNVEWFKKRNEEVSEEELNVMSMEECPTLRPEILTWLTENVKPSTDRERKDRPEGWCVGSEEYRMRETLDISIWFLRRRDAMNFIKTWSEYKKPTTYFNYFNDDRRELIDGKLVSVEQFTRGI